LLQEANKRRDRFIPQGRAQARIAGHHQPRRDRYRSAFGCGAGKGFSVRRTVSTATRAKSSAASRAATGGLNAHFTVYSARSLSLWPACASVASSPPLSSKPADAFSDRVAGLVPDATCQPVADLVGAAMVNSRVLLVVCSLISVPWRWPWASAPPCAAIRWGTVCSTKFCWA
jgi:hypothetical protein